MSAKSLFNSQDYPELNRTLFIVRGVPGSGMASIAKLLADEMYSADDLFYTIGNGEYVYDASQISEAYEQCYRNVLNALRRGVNRIAVHNPFLKKKDYYKYIKAAKAAGYLPFLLTCETSIGPNREISEDKLNAMWHRFERNERGE